MRKIELDFERARRPRRLGVVLLGCAALVVAGMIAWVVLLQQEQLQLTTIRDGLDKHRLGLRAASIGADRPESARQTQQIKRAREVILRISFPWQAFFDLVETAKMESVAIVSLQPDAAAGKILISAEARDLQSALAYLEHLKAGPGLVEASLSSHELRNRGSRSVVKFTVSANWRGKLTAMEEGTVRDPAVANTTLESERK